MIRKFPLGQTVMTRGFENAMTEKGLVPGLEAYKLLNRHSQCDWGDIGDDDKKENEFSLQNNLRLLSAYSVQDVRVWIITEADRSVTTVLLPEDY